MCLSKENFAAAGGKRLFTQTSSPNRSQWLFSQTYMVVFCIPLIVALKTRTMLRIMLLIFAILAAALLYAKVPPVQDRQLDSLVQAGDIGGAQGYLLAKMDGIRELAPEQRQ